MVLTLAIGTILTLVAGFFFVSSVATVLNLLAVAVAGVAGVGLFYNLYNLRPLNLGDVSALFTYSSIGVATGFIVLRVLQHLLSAVGFGVALVVGLLVVLSIVFSPQLVAGLLKSLFEFVLAFVEDR